MGRKKDLDELIAAFGRLVHDEHSNPERIGCPGRPTLASMANKPEAFHADSILDHIRKCAACLDELKDLRTSSRRSQP